MEVDSVLMAQTKGGAANFLEWVAFWQEINAK